MANEDLLKKLSELKRWAINDFPRLAARKTENYVKNNFRLQKYQDGGGTPWVARQFDERKGGAVLIGKQSGLLRDSIRGYSSGAIITVSSDRIYAKIHNEGGTITQAVTQKQSGFFWAKYYEATERKDIATAQRWKRMALSKSLNITIPKRQFMPIEGKNDIPKELQDELRISVENKLKDLF